ncbi:MAG: LytTR family DNA-binding domain-containing protein [Butyrivibrio sp.]|nr:LytTR family DNA-binding domain-containing protein [Butyrivibrio sp.]
MIKTVLVDDDANSRRAAAAALKEYEDIEVAAELDCGDALFEYLESGGAELVFLDIELARETGFEIAERLRAEYPDVMFVFLTGHSTYAIDGYDFQPVNFLTKPINPDKLRRTIGLVRDKSAGKRSFKTGRIMFKCIKGYKVVNTGDICCIERRGRKNWLVTDKEELQIAYYTMGELMDMLEGYGFFLCHQSYIIALDKVETIYEEGRLLYYARLRGCAAAIPISRGHYDELRRAVGEIGGALRL